MNHPGARYPLSLLLPWMLLIALLATGCDPAQDRTISRDRPAVIAVSIQPHAWLVRQIANDDADVITLVQPGEDEHTYQPGDRQITQLIQAHVYFQTGMPFENGPWTQAITQTRRGPRLVDLRQGIELLDMTPHGHDDHASDDHDGHDHGHGHHDHGHGHHSHGHDNHDAHAHADGKDPHIWLAPALLKQQARTVARVLTELDPDSAQAYQDRLTAFEAEMDALDSELRATLTNAPRRFYIYHPAWGYFANAFGLEQVAIEVEGKEPSDAQLTALQQQARAEQVKVIFVQPQITGKSARILADQVGARVVVIDPLAEDVAANLRAVANSMAGAGGDDTATQVPSP